MLLNARIQSSKETIKTSGAEKERRSRQKETEQTMTHSPEHKHKHSPNREEVYDI